jgi:hypothetical protein
MPANPLAPLLHLFLPVIPKQSEGPAVALPLAGGLSLSVIARSCCFFYFSLAFSFAFSFAFSLRCHPEAKRGTRCWFLRERLRLCTRCIAVEDREQ